MHTQWTSLVAVALSSLAGCGSATQPPDRTAENTQPVIPAVFYADADGIPVGAQTPDATPIQKMAGMVKAPVLAPDGHQVTWGEFRRATGTADVSCQAAGTKVHIRFENLLPSGIYTGWLVFFEPPGFKAKLFDALTGMAPIGPSDGSASKFVADAKGAAVFDVVVPPGAVTVSVPNKSHAVPACL